MIRVLALTIAGLIASNAAGLEVKEIIDGVVARDKAWQCGRFVYYECGTLYEVPNSKFNPEDDSKKVSFCGDDWAVVSRNSPLKDWGHPSIATYKGYTTRYTPGFEGRGRDGKLVRDFSRGTVTYMPPRAIDDTTYNRFPIYSFWNQRQKHWVANNVDKFVQVGEETVNGVESVVLEATIPKTGPYAEWKNAFSMAVFPHGATLRLYVAPQLGFVVPRIDESRLDDGRVHVRYDAKNYKKHGDLHVPMEKHLYSSKTGEITATDDSNKCFRMCSVITHIEMFNESPPDSDFEVDFKPGYKIVDKWFSPPNGQD